MKRLFLLISLALLPGCDWFSQSTKIIQGSGSTVRQERSIQGVDEIKLSGVGKLILKQGESESLVIEADENILPHIVSQVEGDTLSIHPEDHALLRSKSEIIYHVTLQPHPSPRKQGMLRGIHRKASPFQVSARQGCHHPHASNSPLTLENQNSSVIYPPAL